MKKWIWVVLALLLVWNSFLTYRLLVPEEKEIVPSNDDPNITEESIVDYTTDLTAVVENTRSSVVRVKYILEKAVYSQSGVVFSINDNKVYILTSRLLSTNDITVIFDNGKSAAATIEKSDIGTGLSILSLETDYNVEPFKLGNSSLLEQGEYIIALGARNEMGSAPVSFGIVSEMSLRRVSPNSTWRADVFETDASINKEFFGGALMNVGGELIGIIVGTPVGAEDNMGFALGVDEAKLVFNEVIEGELERGTIGILTRDVSSLRSYEKSAWNINLGTTNGVLVIDTGEDSKALQVGDVIVACNGETIDSYQDLRKFEYSCVKGDSVILSVIRNGSNMEIEVVMK